MASISNSVPDASNQQALAEYFTHHHLPSKYNAGLIVVSLIVAYLGAYTALLILGKRTSNRGGRNIGLLVLAAVVEASVGIWSLHIMATYSLSLAPAEGIEWRIGLNPSFTAISIIVPTATLILSFLFIDFTAFRLWRTLGSGFFTGATIALLHYSASLSLPAWRVSYDPARLVVSIILAIVVSCVALTLFFRFRSHWDDSWWKRGLCAFLLGSGVSAMHWTGQAASSYRVRPSVLSDIARLSGHEDRKALIAASVFSVLCLIAAAVISIGDVFAAKKTRENARKVVICSATFNKQGQLLVKDDGTLPMVVIETPLRHNEVLEALDKRQTTFQWLYSISWDWNIVVDFLKAMNVRFFLLENAGDISSQHFSQRDRGSFLQKVAHKGPSRPAGKISFDNGRGPQKLVDFRDRFIDAAGQLAVQLDLPFQQIGVLYDQVMPTGTRRAAELAAKAAGISLHSNSSKDDDEAGSTYGRPTPIFGDGEKEQEGAMLFLVREMDQNTDRESEDRYMQRGYRMTDTRFLGAHLARLYAVSKKDMDFWLSNLKMYAKRGTRPVVQPGGVYTGLFGVRASTTRFGGLETLVYSFARHQIPAYRLPKVECVTPQIRHFVRCLDRMTLEEAQDTCRREATLASERLKSLSAVRVSREQSRARDAEEEQEIMAETDVLDHISSFQMSLCVALDALQASVRFYPRLGSTARLSADILEVPSSLDDSTAPAEMILVQAVLPDDRTVFNSSQIDASQVIPTDQPHPDTPFVFTPYSLFSKSQMMLLKGRQADLFEQEVLWELKCRYPEVEPAHAAKVSGKGDIEGLEKAGSLSPSSKVGGLSPQMDAIEILEHSRDGKIANQRTFSRRLRSLVPDHIRKSSLSGPHGDAPVSEVEMQATSNAPAAISASQSDRNHVALSPSIPKQSSLDWTSVQRLSRHEPTIASPASNSTGLTLAPGSNTSASLTHTLAPSAFGTSAESAPGAGQSLGIRRFLQTSVSGDPSAAGLSQSPDRNPLRSRGDSVTSTRIGSPSRDDAVSKSDASFLHMSYSRPGTANTTAGPEALDTVTAAGAEVPANSLLLSNPPRSHPHQSARRPSTAQPTRTASLRVADAGSRPGTADRTANAIGAIQRVRPRTADVESRPVGLPLSQRRMTASGSRANPRSITARTRSDDWMSRHLSAIEKGPGGQGLLGVDY
ncbi:unnamed protein product [Parajaminaea phylloscopi]